MAILPVILIVFLAVAALAFAMWPLVRRPIPTQATSAGPLTPSAGVNASAGLGYLTAQDELIARRDALYAHLKDAEFDHEMGKLGEEDYQVLRTRSMREAAGVLRQLDHLTPDAEATVDREIELAVSRLRTGAADSGRPTLSPEVVQAVEAEIAALARHGGVSGKPGQLVCPNCGRDYHAGDAFCAHCGAPLRPGAANEEGGHVDDR